VVVHPEMLAPLDLSKLDNKLFYVERVAYFDS
jgi:hypothetical protein